MVSEREQLIGARLRIFREALQIPRARFAISIGYGGERIASYEAGRAALPFEVFKAIFLRYDLNPKWLATHEGSPRSDGLIHISVFPANVRRGATFTQVYDEVLHAHFVKMQQQVSSEFDELMKKLLAYIAKEKALSGYRFGEASEDRVLNSLEDFLSKLKEHLQHLRSVRPRIKGKRAVKK